MTEEGRPVPDATTGVFFISWATLGEEITGCTVSSLRSNQYFALPWGNPEQWYTVNLLTFHGLARRREVVPSPRVGVISLHQQNRVVSLEMDKLEHEGEPNFYCSRRAFVFYV